MLLQEPINLLNPESPLPKDPSPRRRRVLYAIIVLILVVGVIWIFRRVSLAYWPSDPAVYDAVTLRPKNIGFLQTVKNFIFHSDNIVEGQQSNRVNILVMGIGGPGHNGPFLSDANIIVSIKPSTKEVAFVSIPRDLGVQVGDHGIRKINSADAFGEAERAGNGGEYARSIFESTFGQTIPYYVRIDFKAFEELIDTVGGVTVNVPKGFTDSQFPGENSQHQEDTSYQTITFTAGVETMNGHRALQYVRSRHGTNGEDSDFARSRRQQLVMSALKEKLLSVGTYLNPVQAQSIMSSLTNHVVTNFDFGQMMYLANLGRDIQGPIKTLVLDNSPKGFLVSSINESGAFILSPKTGNFDTIKEAIDHVFDATSTVAMASSSNISGTGSSNNFPSFKIEIQNGTWRAGLASRIKKRLDDHGFSVIAIGNSLLRPVTTTAIYLLNPKTDAAALANLAKIFPAHTTAALPDWLTTSYDNPATPENEGGMKFNNDADILIVLGANTKE